MKLKGKKSTEEEKKEKQSRGNFFERMIKAAPSKCMETGRPLAPTMAINPAAVVCHILAKSKKSGVPSMAENELNIVYLDGSVHTDMDNKGCDFIIKMKIFPLMRRRVVLMWPHIPEHERRRVPECLRPGYALDEIMKD